MNIYPVHMGITRCYLIQDKGIILVDGGAPKKLGSFMRCIQKASISPEQITLIVQTHGHWDHIGSTLAIKNVTGAQIAMHEPDKEWLEKALNNLPPGATPWGRTFLKLTSGFMRSAQIPAAKVDIALQDEEFSLAPFGIKGKVVYTPGHTRGSVSVVLETGEAFVGDLAMNGLPFGFRPGLPILAEDIKQVKESCRRLLDMGVKKFYPGHGNPFPADIIRKLV
jgi:hydroxyacylglutathione hydrolase